MIRSMFLPGAPIGRRDVAIAAVLSLLGLVLMYDDAINHTINASYLAMPVFLAVTVPVLWRRAAPLAASAAVLVALLVHVALFGTITRCGVVFPVVWVLVFAAGARLELRAALIALALGLCSIAVMASSDSQVNVVHAAPFAVVSAIVWGAGRLARSRSRMTAELQGRTEELRNARDERARLEVATDRARLSGELDELLHQRLGELARLADAGAHDIDPGSATATLAGIERASRQTLEEMRALVGVLRRPDENGGAITPQPTLTSLDALIVNAKGADAHMTVQGSPRALPAGVELSAYRIVEHLLGALDDAPGIDVRVRFGDTTLDVAVSGPASRRREIASAIERARERAQLHRGTFEATVSGGRARAVAELPLIAGA
jgi:hypothetical protein